MNLKRSLRNILFLARQNGPTATWRLITDRLYVRWFEWRLGIRSEAVIGLKELGLDNESYRPYVPTDYRSFQRVLNSLRICPGKEVFLDFGSGLGRAVILAATRPFRRVIGVEIAPQLNELAQQNVLNALPRLRCRNVELIIADATTFAVPPDVTLIYFFNPFCGEILLQVLANIRTSFGKNPRDLRLICKIPAQSAFERDIERVSWLVKEREMVFDSNSRYLLLSVRS
jgi:SAM-dependent methyltransferase